MASAAVRHATIRDAGTFLEWAAWQSGKYEFVGGTIVAMSGGTLPHSLLTMRLAAMLEGKTGDGPCRLVEDDFALKMPSDEIFRPDLMIARGGFEDYATTEPLLIIEVLSPTTEAEWRHRLPRLMALPSLRHILLVAQGEVRVEHHMQGEGGWLARLLVGPEAAIHLPELGFTMMLAQLYRGILR